MALVTKVPGMTLFAPSSYQELGVMLHDALDLCTGPATIRWSKTAAPSVPDEEVGSGLSARKVRPGRDVCILAVGKMVGAARDTAFDVAADGRFLLVKSDERAQLTQIAVLQNWIGARQ